MISVGSNLSLEVRTCIEKKKKKILLTQFFGARRFVLMVRQLFLALVSVTGGVTFYFILGKNDRLYQAI